ncbi:hypothetical protein EC973_002169 [Apophysomyces ossiformis]|uniref:Membrane anchor Opy2 N-terminal domain-containing protein n=1 Tax=Apophysomyces ossiformis TaxID=679940 RepID=A0A8H7BGY8_9FUNG|nr:hypothetical protein EC973_002169 [Apophysomyces ossiformis]
MPSPGLDLGSYSIITCPCGGQSNASCMPSGCTAQCASHCSADEICVLGTMSQCGVCPASECISKSYLYPSGQNSDPNSNGDGGSNAALIGGIVGGLVGSGFLLAVAGYVFFRYKKKKNTLPLAFCGKSMPGKLEVGPQTREVMSGVIPVAYIPPSRDIESNESLSERRSQPSPISPSQFPNTNSSTATPVYSQYMSMSTFPQTENNNNSTWRTDDPFSDNHSTDDPRARAHRSSQFLSIGGRSEYDDDDDDDLSNRGSMASSVGHVHTPVKATQAFQVTRAKPQILRVNTMRVDGSGGLNRSGSVRTILTKEESPTTTGLTRSNTTPVRRRPSPTESGPVIELTSPTSPEDRNKRHTSAPPATEDPFHDRHSITEPRSSSSAMPSASSSTEHISSSRSKPQATDSMVSAPGDGEITVFWSGHGSS